MKRYLVALLVGVAVSALAACQEEADPAAGQEEAAPATEQGAAGRILPEHLVYVGAFRLPDGPEEYAWLWSGQGMAYHGGGDADGPDDGHPGSLFGVGHDWNQWVSEVSIPKPVVSEARDLSALPTARTLQPFANIRGEGMFDDLEQARAGLAILPPMGEQKTGKLYFCWGPHMADTRRDPSHGWCELDLSDPRPAGPWRIAGLWNYVTTDYLLEIPARWAEAHAKGARLGTGRFRDGGQGSMGPALFAMAPWKGGNPPEAGAEIPAVTLLRYSSMYDDPPRHTVKDYHHSDEWSGAAWLTTGKRSAVVFVGTKGVGKCWYGFANGVVWPEEGPWPEVPDAPNDQRGWWSTKFVGRMLFYDTGDLASVASGKKKPHEPQPYAIMEIDEFLYGVKSPQQTRHVGACAFDRERGLLYVFEFRGDEDKSLVHCWRVQPT